MSRRDFAAHNDGDCDSALCDYCAREHEWEAGE